MHQLDRINYDSVPVIVKYLHQLVTNLLRYVSVKAKKKKTMGSQIIESFGYKFSAMGSGFLSSHFSQQSVLKLPAIIAIIDASMNMKSSLGKDLKQIASLNDTLIEVHFACRITQTALIKFADHANNKIFDPNWNVFGTINESTFRFTIFAL
ncbi:Uncharacterized protein BM_BM9926 [Brugia malayi]|uniref:Bm9926 n=1 Tax=Brugia malayi TaxID=6279 RepID=A0A0H5S779_BRUMA|nr:Uncharacterized protein BM_BM9926 [Brugia malayi]CRZ24470.1 Bm9926 [Brugia malayi]VIO89018.1 Uncharacterized protein BM_BM9926 [Brugia malayi]